MKKKRLIWLIWLGALLLDVGMIPFDLFVHAMPEWITIVGAVVLVASIVVMFRLWIGRRFVKVIFTVVSGILAVITILGSYCNPYWNFNYFHEAKTLPYHQVMSYGEAKADLDYAIGRVKKVHPIAIDGLPDDIEAKYKKAEEHLRQTEKITVNQLLIEIERVLSAIGDAHTYVTNTGDERHYMKSVKQHNDKEEKMTTIGGITLEDLFENNKDKFSFESKEWGMHRMHRYLSSIEGLDYLGISVDPSLDITYKDPQGTVIKETVTSKDYLTYKEYLAYNQMKETEDETFVSYTVDEARSLAILTLTQCVYNQTYKDCVEKMFREIKAKNIQNVAVDLRDNGGGNSLVANEFFRYLDVKEYKEMASRWRFGPIFYDTKQYVATNDQKTDLTFKGKLYLLTGVGSFSAAMDFAEYVKDNEMGTIIGETCGNSPNSYGEIVTFSLPNSGIFMQSSTKKWIRIDKKEGMIEPDIPCESSKALESLYAAIQ